MRESGLVEYIPTENGILQIAHQPNGWIRKKLIVSDTIPEPYPEEKRPPDLELLSELRI